MFPKINRLSKNEDIKSVLKAGKPLKRDFLIFKILENNLGYNRFGFVVPKKQAAKAVSRNKIKRTLREILRAENGQLKKGFDVVLIVKAGFENKLFKEIKNLVGKSLECLKKI